MPITKGQTFQDSEVVDKYRTLYYAGASGDFHPVHIDPEFGKMVGLGGAILHGLCTMAFATRSVTNLIGDPGKLKKLKCRFSAPVMIEDTITMQGTVADIKDGLGYIDLKVTTQTGAEVLQKVAAVVEE